MRTVGIEVEFVGPGEEVAASLVRAGIPCQAVNTYSARNNHGEWLVCPDQSVTGNGYSMLHGGELKSPILRFDSEADREMMAKAIVAGREGGMRPTEKCGVHVHVGSNGLEHENLVKIVRFFVRFEDAIYRLASSGWKALRPEIGRYAPPLTDDQISRIMSSKYLEDIRYIAGHFNGLHLESHWIKGTIEFRMFNGSINPDRIQAYVSLCHQIVRDSELGWKRNLGQAYRLGTMASGTVTEEKVRNYFFRVLGGNQERPGLSTKDLRLLGKCWRDSVPQLQPTRTSY